MKNFNIYEIDDKEYVAVSADEEGPFDTPDGQIALDTSGTWVPGSMADLYRSTLDAALAAWMDAGKPGYREDTALFDT